MSVFLFNVIYNSRIEHEPKSHLIFAATSRDICKLKNTEID